MTILTIGGTSGTAGIADGIDGLTCAALSGGTASKIMDGGGGAHTAGDKMFVILLRILLHFIRLTLV